MDQIKIGKFIASCRKDQGMTQAVLAEKLGISDRAVSKWENGRSMPDIEKLELLSEMFEISVSELLKGERLESQPTEEDVAQASIASFSVARHYVQTRKWLHLALGFLWGVVIILVAVIHMTSPVPVKDPEQALRVEVLGGKEIIGVLDPSIAGCEVSPIEDSENGTHMVFVSCYTTLWNRLFGSHNQTLVLLGDTEDTDYVYYYPSEEADRLIWKNPASEDPAGEVQTLPRLVYHYWLVIAAGLSVIGVFLCLGFRKKRPFATAVRITLAPIALTAGLAAVLAGRGAIYDSAYYFTGILLLSAAIYAALRITFELGYGKTKSKTPD